MNDKHIKKPDFIPDMEEIYGGTAAKIIVALFTVAIVLVIVTIGMIITYSVN